MEQCSKATGQRGWKRQPFGGLTGLGTSPCKIIRSRLRVGSGMGMADINAWVRGQLKDRDIEVAALFCFKVDVG